MKQEKDSEHTCIEDGYARLAVLLATLQKNVEKTKSDRVGALNLKNSEVFLMYMLHHYNPAGSEGGALRRGSGQGMPRGWFLSFPEPPLTFTQRIDRIQEFGNGQAAVS